MKYFLVFLVLSGMMLTSCRTSIPARDTVQPNFIFRINGDGFNIEIDKNFDFDNSALYLKRDAIYRAFYIPSDEGGLKTASFTYPNDVLRIERIEGFTTTNTGNPYINRKQFNGVEEDPRSRAVLTIDRLVAVGGQQTGSIENYELNFHVRDFHDNVLDKTLVIRVTFQDTGIRPRD